MRSEGREYLTQEALIVKVLHLLVNIWVLTGRQIIILLEKLFNVEIIFVLSKS
jgi:hypothetical protein